MTNENKIPHNETTLFFKPEYINAVYGVIFNYVEKKLKIHYEIECRFIKYTENMSGYLLSLNRKQVYINNKAPDTKMYTMADELAKCIYPIRLQMNKQHEIVSIVNYDEIVKRSKQVKENLQGYYTGEAAENCLRLFEGHCSNPNHLLQQLQNDLFFKLFFFPVHKQYSKQLTATSTVFFLHNQKKQKNTFDITHCLDSYYTPSGRIMIQLESIQKRKTEKEKSTFEAQYRLYADSFSILAIVGEMELRGNSRTLSTVQFEVYDLFPKERTQRGKAKKSIIIDESFVEIKKKNTFWDRFK